ncbi:uncharacterized protein LOC141630247 [Silene latifolia]|uniref:uncharacterized protein LOC141630247 n=1 Tax=Silene latifolia TaxID=37657 RepID=UPI003D76B60C
MCVDWSICTNNSFHKGGRVWLLWDPKLYNVEVLHISAQCIHSRVVNKVNRMVFWLSMVYGFNKAHEREPLWEDLRGYSSCVNGPWMVCGDFNSIMNVGERIGGAAVTRAEMAPMRDAVDFCQLQELKVSGSYYTWNNKHEVSSKVYSKLDRVLVNEEWLQVLPDTVANFLPEDIFDHCPCVINTTVARDKSKLAFKYFNMWSLAEGFIGLVKEGWQEEIHGSLMFRIVKKLKGLKHRLKQLNREHFSDIENLTQSLKWL